MDSPVQASASLDLASSSSAAATVGGSIFSGGGAYQVPANFFTANTTPAVAGPSIPWTDIAVGIAAIIAIIYIARR